MENNAYLRVDNLTVHYVSKKETVYAVNDISFSLEKGKVLGLVGETGAGKTTIAKAILGLLPTQQAQIKSGKVLLNNENLLDFTEDQMYTVRGKRITMIFQDPMTALNPVKSVGDQIAEVIRLHNDIPKSEVRKRAENMLETVGIPAARYVEYPHQFSGGMKQRVVIAIALACSPEILLADEPTTALDVTIQAQVLDLMKELNKENQTTTILITHDLGVVAEMCDEVAIVYAGEIVESGSLANIFKNPKHPYTLGLFGALPKLDQDIEWLSPIEGLSPDPTALPEGCKFNPRCKYACESCKKVEPELKEIEPGHMCRCILVDEKRGVE